MGDESPSWEEQRERLFELQGGRCGVCRYSFNPNEMRLDHDHASGLTRGLLCGVCNPLEGRSDGPGFVAYRADPPAKELDWIYPDPLFGWAAPAPPSVPIDDALEVPDDGATTLGSLFELAIDQGWPFRRLLAQDQRAAEALGKALKPKRARARKAIGSGATVKA